MTACPNNGGKDEVTLTRTEEIKIPFDTLKEIGFVPPAIRLPDSYVNDKIENKAKKLSYDFCYHRLDKDDEFKKIGEDVVFGNSFHTTTISEEDAGLDSKAKVTYDKLKKANGGGDICVGTRFIIGLKVIDQSGKLVYKALMPRTVWAHASTATSDESLKVSVPGNQLACDDVAIEGASGTFDMSLTVYENGKTVYTLPTTAKKKFVQLKYGEFGLTNKVLVKE